MSNKRSQAKTKKQEVLFFKEHVKQWAEKIGVQPKRVQVQPMTAKWASCSRKGRVTFSSDLLDESNRFADYVIIHELLHLQVPNHGKLFKSLLNAFLPGSDAIAKGRSLCHISPE